MTSVYKCYSSGQQFSLVAFSLDKWRLCGRKHFELKLSSVIRNKYRLQDSWMFSQVTEKIIKSAKKIKLFFFLIATLSNIVLYNWVTYVNNLMLSPLMALLLWWFWIRPFTGWPTTFCFFLYSLNLQSTFLRLWILAIATGHSTPLIWMPPLPGPMLYFRYFNPVLLKSQRTIRLWHNVINSNKKTTFKKTIINKRRNINTKTANCSHSPISSGQLIISST